MAFFSKKKKNKSIQKSWQRKGAKAYPGTLKKEKPQKGEVIAVGKGKVLEDGTVKALEVKAGDKVLYGKYSGSEISHDSQDYLILKEEEILAIIK